MNLPFLNETDIQIAYASCENLEIQKIAKFTLIQIYLKQNNNHISMCFNLQI